MADLPDSAIPTDTWLEGQSDSDSTLPPDMSGIPLLIPSIFPPSKQIVLILVGLVASGKSTFAQALERFYPQFKRCNQDELGDRRSVEALARQSLRDGLSICIDRANFDESQRATWINIAREVPETPAWVLVFDTPFEVCASRLAERTDHPTIKTPELGLEVLRRFQSLYQPPLPHEGYARILHLTPSDLPETAYTEADVREIMVRLQDAPEVVPSAPPAPRGGLRGSFRDSRGFSPRGYQPRGGPLYRGGGFPRGGYREEGLHQSSSPWRSQYQSRGSPPTRPQSSSWRGSSRGYSSEDRYEGNWRK